MDQIYLKMSQNIPIIILLSSLSGFPIQLPPFSLFPVSCPDLFAHLLTLLV
jgi:hypothetical protein